MSENELLLLSNSTLHTALESSSEEQSKFFTDSLFSARRDLNEREQEIKRLETLLTHSHSQQKVDQVEQPIKKEANIDRKKRRAINDRNEPPISPPLTAFDLPYTPTARDNPFQMPPSSKKKRPKRKAAYL